MRKRILIIAGWMMIIYSAVFYGFSQDIEPSEPGIVLPSVLLEIEDLSIESITAGLPEDKELLPPEIEFPLPEIEELAIDDPHLDLTVPKSGVPAFQIREGKYLTTEAVLGIGTANQFFSRISLYYLGKKPEGKIQYQHETIDGFSSKPPGSGYSNTEDMLEGYLSFDAGKARIRTDGVFYEIERGLQGKGNFYSKVNRFIEADGTAEYPISDIFVLKGSLNFSLAAQLMTGGPSSSSDEVTELYLSPVLVGEFRFKNWVLGVEPRFSYRNVFESENLSLIRGGVRGYLEVDISDSVTLNGSVGWLWVENIGHLAPFNLSVSMMPGDFFTLTVGGGYRVEEFNLRDIFRNYPLTGVPLSLYDNQGWFAELKSIWTPFQGWIFDAGLFYTGNSKMPDPGRAFDGATGLFPLSQVNAQRLNIDAGVRWNISESFSARLGWSSAFIEKPEFYPENRINLDFNGMEKKGRFGGGFSSEFTTGVNDSVQLPLLSLNGFFRATDFLRFVLEADDLLYPLLDGPRYLWEPYVDTGLKVILKAHINF
ncbi:MAG TPA: hypothetical protein ENI15_03460 [Spirochaetes bacterium]|nr:hypothetical protein [Spirochaetota bacterium]